MKLFLRTILLCVAAIAVAGDAVAQPPGRSRLPADLNSCALCHGLSEFWKGDQLRLLITAEHLADDVHYLNGVKCRDCHGGNPQSFDVAEAHSTEAAGSPEALPFRSPLSEVRKACAKCHQDQHLALTGGAHAEGVWKDEQGRETPLGCGACHGDKIHGMLPVSDPRSPVFRDNQVRLCGGCHEEDLQQYYKSVHGHALRQSGLLVVAICADCHGAHGIYPASDEASTLHAANAAGTCAKCHRFIEERLRHSVHGRGNGPGGPTEDPAPGGDMKRKPTCTDCHQGHDLPHPRTAAFRLRLPGRCGNCHVDLSRRYGMSLHGELTDLGYGPAAKCSDCHGAHDIVPVSDPGSPLAVGENRLATCRKCHPYAVQNFCDFHPHADQEDWQRNPLLYVIYVTMELLICSVFAFFGVHTVLWFVRSLVHVLRHGRPRRLAAGRPAYVRFDSFNRVLHAVVIVSFLGLALTGLPLRYSDQAWAYTLARFLGGFESTSVWHHICGVVTICYFVTHLAWLAEKVLVRRKQGTGWISLFFGPDSPVPNLRDLTDMFRMARWFAGLGPKPVFERWTYWEKFDYWAVFWGVGIIGTSGLMLWFPNLFSRFLPGEALNVAKIVHSEEALLATSFIFAIHFFGTHLRPEKFPMDMAVLSGLVSEQELQEERPEFIERMRQEGKLAELETTPRSRRNLYAIAAAGCLALAVGLGLLAGILAAVAGE